jgi:hypothetical protein
MTLWFRKTEGLNSETLRNAALNGDVSWDEQTIKYNKRGIGYENGDTTDATAIKDELEELLGYRPVQIDNSPIE